VETQPLIFGRVIYNSYNERSGYMLDKIFNRKYLKAIREIEEEIEYYRGREQYYRNELLIKGEYYEVKATIESIDYYRHRVNALQTTLQQLKLQLH
jgi:hypothetical protein